MQKEAIMLRSLTAVLCFFAFLHPLSAATLQQLSVDQIVSLSTAIVRGKVTDFYVASSGNTIYTHYKVQVLERLKGATSGSSPDTADVAVPGGAYNGQRQSFPGIPALQIGGEYLLFLWTGHSGPTQLIGLNQGLFKMGEDASGEPLATREATSEIMLDAKGATVNDHPVALRLSDVRARLSVVARKGSGQ